MSEHLLQIALPMAVGLRILEVLQMPEDQRPKPDDMIACLACNGQAMGCAVCGDHGALPRQEAYSSYIAAHGDNLLYRGPKAGDTARAFNVLVKAVALMSFVPGGVEVFGQRYDAATLERRVKGGLQVLTRIVRKTEPAVPVVVVQEVTGQPERALRRWARWVVKEMSDQRAKAVSIVVVPEGQTEGWMRVIKEMRRG